jgi:hypothetical protein
MPMEALMLIHHDSPDQHHVAQTVETPEGLGFAACFRQY